MESIRDIRARDGGQGREGGKEGGAYLLRGRYMLFDVSSMGMVGHYLDDLGSVGALREGGMEGGREGGREGWIWGRRERRTKVGR